MTLRRASRLTSWRGFAALLLLPVLVSACAAAPNCPQAAPQPDLARFYASLDELKSGARKTPVTVLHIGDSHIALDHMTGVLRARWQAAFGDAGRGLPPGVAYPYYSPQGYTVAMSGPWAVASSLKAGVAGPFGLQGFRVSSASAGAEIALQTGHDVGMVEIDAMGGPTSGSLLLKLDGAAPLRLSTRASSPGLVRLHAPAAAAHRVLLTPLGDGPVTLLGWAMLTGKPGIRYDSYGISGATLDVVSHWDAAIVDEQIRALAPDLIMLGYGTNEGFNDRLDLGAYAARLEALIVRLKRLAPNASIAVLGSFDGARRAKPGAVKICGDGWMTPPKLGPLRETQKQVAERAGATFFDGSRVMGQACGIEQWVNGTPPLAWPDHVHLRPEGSRRAGAALWAELMGAYEARACAR
ncbi:MAG TPA: GDSL-type esterase/lipase family protein [Parvibaculum sp.]|jgi:lysophospholipase L1-like esterase